MLTNEKQQQIKETNFVLNNSSSNSSQLIIKNSFLNRKIKDKFVVFNYIEKKFNNVISKLSTLFINNNNNTNNN